MLIRGKSIVWGFAIGRAVYYQDVLTREFELWTLSESQVEEELKRLQDAIDKAHFDLANLKTKVTHEIDAKHAEIFGVHQVILKDIGLFKEIEKELRDRLLNAENIVQNVFQRWENKIRSAGNNTPQERLDDVIDVGKRLLMALVGLNKKNASNLPANSIIFAQRLLPSDTAALNVNNVKAIVTVEGAENSHSAILARAMDIPFVSKINVNVASVPHGTRVIVDGENGRIIINPSLKELRIYPKLIKNRLKNKLKAIQQIKDIDLKTDGKPIRVTANVSSLNDIKMAHTFGADSIGLYRTEYLYMGKKNLPTEDSLFSQLTKALNHVRTMEVTLRLLDIGGDKTLPFLDLVDIKNPALGLNGIRLLLKYPRLLQMQLRVFLRLSAQFKVKVLVPMIALPKDMMEARRYLSEEKEKLRKEKVLFDEHLPFGAMIETPAALLTIDELLELSDFISIGTNDLIQYIMAASREKINVSDYYDAGNHLILNAVRTVIHKAEELNKECSICGELAGNLNFTEALLDIKLRNFSVQPSLIPDLKNKIFHILKAAGRQSE
ncbi:MAG: phosphoenolpyruvate--protein phosphotransferase [Candidatus Aureabacteria bacterium]|nr:phosphoenolpyruvate--protein phosphotransferase [Candidatus Auribacterota bacterium]